MNQQDEALWAAAGLLFGVGDIVTTNIGLQQDDVHEGNPVAAGVLGLGGTPAMVATKLVVFCAAFWGYRAAPEEYRMGVPLGLALLGAFIVAHNYRVIQASEGA